jgi:ABC-2 type transport system ATP-binding protein
VISRDQNLLAISCSGLVKHYPRVIAVDGIDLQVKSGECFGLLGPNGAGKTTTVEILEGLTRPDGGIVELFGKRWGSGRDHELRKELGIQLQESQQPPKLTVFEAIRLFRSFYDQGRDIDEIIGLVELEEKRDARFEKLSGGQKQRLSLATALVGNPRILFLDEPTTGLDPQARLKIWEIIEGFKTEGGTTLLTTHYMEEAARLCDRVAIIDHGKVIAVDRPTELVAAMNADQIVEFRTRPALTTGQESEICALSGVGSLACHEGALVLSVSRIGATLPTLLAALDQHGLEVLELKTHQPTLEDVFVSLTGRALRDD